MLIIRVSPTFVHVVSGSPIPSGSTNAPTVRFRLDAYWADYAVTAVFENDGTKRYLANIAEGVDYPVPWECINEAGVLSISVFGVKSGARSTTLSATVQVLDSGLPGSLPSPPTPSAYEQYVAQVQNASETAGIAANAAQLAQTAAETAAETAADTVEIIEEIPQKQAAMNALVAQAEEAVQTANEASAEARRAAQTKPEALVEINHRRVMKFWFGTAAEFQTQKAAGLIGDTTFCVLTDDPAAAQLSAFVQKVEAYITQQISPASVLSNALDVDTANPVAERNYRKGIVAPTTLNRPSVEGFYGIRQPVEYCDENSPAIVTVVEVTPVYGRRWVNKFGNDHAMPADNAWYGWQQR